MDPKAASRYLHPRRLCIAIAAASSTLGDLGAGAIPILYALIADDVGRPRSAFPPRTPSDSYADLVAALANVSFTAANNMALQLGIDIAVEDAEDLPAFLRTVLDAVLKSPDGLNDAVELMEPQIDPAMHGAYEPDGVIACFMRKVCVAFASSSFETQARLDDALRRYVCSSESGEKVNGPVQEVPSTFVTRKAAVSLADGVPVQDDGHFASISYIHAQSREATSATNMALRGMPSIGREQRTDMALPAAEFVMHLEAQRRRDCSSAADSLHRYYDLALAEIARDTAARAAAGPRDVSATAAANDEEHDYQLSVRDATFAGDASFRHEAQGHQYAALSLAAMHVQFGNHARASVALDHAIRTAQQYGDDACQARALMWIARTSVSNIKRHQLLQHAQDPLSLAREELQTVATPFAEDALVSSSAGLIFGEARKGASLQEKDQRHQGAIASARLQRIQSCVGLARSDFSVDSLLVSAAAWESHASLPTALSIASMALRVAEDEHPGVMWAGRAHAMVAVASLKAMAGEAVAAITMLTEAAEGTPGEADCVGRLTVKSMFSAGQSSSMPERELLKRCRTWIEFERCLRRCEVRLAGRLAERIAAFGEGSNGSGLALGAEDCKLDAIEARCRWSLLCESSQEAAKNADALCRSAAACSRPGRVVEGLRLGAESHLQAGSSNSAMPLALAAVSLSRGLGLEAAHVRCLLTLTDTMLRMDSSGSRTSAVAAQRALAPVLPKALEGLGAQTRGCARRLQAECLLALASSSSSVSPDFPRSLDDQILEALALALDAYGEAEDLQGQRDCAYILARVHHRRREPKKRNEASRLFKKHAELLAIRQSEFGLNNSY